MNKKTQVLVVDDDPDFRLQQKVSLVAAGYDVLEAETAADGLNMLNDGTPDIAIIDLMMEEDDAGFALCYQMKKQLPEMPVIMVTAVASEAGIEFTADTREEKNWIKADAVLAKPIRFEQLEKEIQTLLG